MGHNVCIRVHGKKVYTHGGKAEINQTMQRFDVFFYRFLKMYSTNILIHFVTENLIFAVNTLPVSTLNFERRATRMRHFRNSFGWHFPWSKNRDTQAAQEHTKSNSHFSLSKLVVSTYSAEVVCNHNLDD